MKKSILKFTAISVILSLTLTSLSAEDFSKLDVKKECDKSKWCLKKKLLETAEKYNKLAIENKVEFMRLGMKASQYIDLSKEALKSGAKEIEIVDDKAKPTGEMVSLEFAAWRSCSFAISALTQMEDSKKIGN